jgi:SAM-dependent methyltransferase
MAPASEPRSLERLRHHYEVEKRLADRLKAAANPAARARIYATMYDELFAAVPDHPRLTRQRDPAAERLQVDRLLALLQPYLGPRVEYVEFGAGTGALTFAVSPRVARARAVEIADQLPPGVPRPANFELVLYDGYHLDIAPDSVDLVFSEQFVEHLHPDDAEHHFTLVHRMLKPGGRYLLRTPERWTGPHDVSRWFSDIAQGFHLHEWTYREIGAVARRIGYRRAQAFWNARGRCVAWPWPVAIATEACIARWPPGLRRTLGHRLIPMVTLAVVK